MSESYTPGTEADAIVARQIAEGRFSTPDEAVRAAIQLLEEGEAALAALRTGIDEADAAFAKGDYTAYATADEFVLDIQRLGDERLLQKN